MVLVRPAEHRHRHDRARCATPFAARRNRDPLLDPLVWAWRVEVAERVVAQHSQQVAPAEDDDSAAKDGTRRDRVERAGLDSRLRSRSIRPAVRLVLKPLV
jgi:hypothetical protein